MDQSLSIVDRLLTEVFHDILNIEEAALQFSCFKDVSITEVHTVEAIGLHSKLTMSEVAKKLNITVGTLTVAIKNLVGKGYVTRFTSSRDKRVVQLGLTKKGRVLYRIHKKFHQQMVVEVVDEFSAQELMVLTTALEKLHTYLIQKREVFL